MAEQQQPTVAIAHAVSLKLPEFWPSDPDLWFARVEASFEAQGITLEKTKFGHVVRVLPAQYASEVLDIILSPPKSSYTAIKDALKKRVCPSKRQQLQQLLHLEELGDRKPSQLLRHMLKLRGGTITEADGDEIFREIFLQKLPTHIRTVLAIHKAESLGNLADMADNMAEMQGPQQPVQACAVQQKESSDMSEIRAELKKIWQEIQCQKQGSYSNTSQTSTSKTDLCWYHAKFGSKATKCREPCKFQSGNRPTSQ